MTNKKEFNADITLDFGDEFGKKTFSSYEEKVDFLAQNRISHLFSNSNMDHSKMLIEKFVDNIDGVLCLYTRSFKKAIFNNSQLVLKIRNFLQRDENNEVKIIVEDKNCTSEKLKKDNFTFFKMLNQYAKDSRITFKKLSEKLRPLENRYMVLDTAFRYATESDDEDFKAIVNFNRPTISKILQKNFDDRFMNSQTLEWN